MVGNEPPLMASQKLLHISIIISGEIFDSFIVFDLNLEYILILNN